VRLTTLAAARTLTSPTFLKPANDKCFRAAVYAGGAELPGADMLPGAVPVLAAEPVTWDVEYRAFVLERRLAALSIYLRAGELAQDEDGAWPAPAEDERAARAFVEVVLADARVALPPAVVADVGRVAGRGWAVIEANAARGSGLYGCAPAAVLPVLRRAIRPTAALTSEDQRWVVAREGDAG
jgi:hypothetical protein